jgi:hypothetical protein
MRLEFWPVRGTKPAIAILNPKRKLPVLFYAFLNNEDKLMAARLR